MAETRLTERYLTEKKSLNPEQLRAVETIEGPVMVLAGPGTGKTQILAFRIAEILLQTDATPRNILALTFTESGVAAMRERLVSLIGPTAYGVGIYTFHSFANRVIMESGAEFYKTHTLNQIDDITQLKLVMELLDRTESELLRPPRSPYFYVKPCISAIRSLKSEGVTPANLKLLCEATITDLKDDPASVSKAGKSKGELKQAVKDKIQQYERTIAFAELYAGYEAEITERGLYDYEDMILFVVRTLAENADLKARYQEQFRYILVDEYQDTNNAQNTLVRLLGDYFENPNIFVVGDDKQSIYRFQGASTANLLDFRQWYPDATFISLKENYRSGQPILDAATILINQNTEQLTNVMSDVHADLHAQSSEAKVNLTPYATVDQETGGVVACIKELIDNGTDPSDIAIIYRQNHEAAVFSELLAKYAVPFQLEAGDDLLRDGDIRHILQLLTLADTPQNDSAFFHLLHAPYSGMATGDLVKISRYTKEKRQTWWQLMDGDKPDTFDDAAWETLLSWKEKVGEWYRYQTSHTIVETVEHVLLHSGFLGTVMQHPNQLQRLHRIRVFFDDVKCLAETTDFPTLKDLFARIEIRQKYNLALIARPLVESSQQAVRLMTAHKSKGLEFTYVFIPGVTSDRWGAGKGMSGLKLPDGIVSHHQTTEEQDIEEERRLFYVALTRAKKQVTVSYAEVDGEGRKLLPSQFITEIEQFNITPSTVSATLLLQSFFSPIRDDYVSATTQAYLKEIVAKHPITPTGLNTYLMCPMEYLYHDIYCIPGIRGIDEAYGTAVHKALEMWGSWSKNEGSLVSLNSILSVFYECLGKESLTEPELYRYRKLGETVLTAYYEHQHRQWVTPLATEYSFSPHNVAFQNIPITGKIDKIEPIPGSKSVRLIDYKTGRVRSRNDIEGKTASSDGDYKRQLVFYTVLAETDPFFPYTVGEVAISFVDDAMKFATEVFEISQQEKQEVKELIVNVYNEMNLLHFDHTPHKKPYGRGESLCDILRSQVL